jgi:thymidine phosphorylase
LALSGHAEGEAEERVKAAISSGHAMVCFASMVRAMGGPPDIADDWHTHLPKAPVVGDVPAPKSGVIRKIDGEALGLAVVRMGGGRQKESDRIDPRVGLSEVVELGMKVNRGDPIATIHAADEDSAEAAAHAILRAVDIGESVDLNDLILERVDP